MNQVRKRNSFHISKTFSQRSLKQNIALIINLIVKILAKNNTRIEPVLFGVHGDAVKPGKNIEPILKDGIVRSKRESILGSGDDWYYITFRSNQNS